MAIADIGAGSGLFSRLFVKKVGPTGKVFALDIIESFVDHINKTARENNLNNLYGIVSNENSLGLKPNSIDMAFLCDTYHHLEYPYKVLESVKRALRDKGRLIIIEFEKNRNLVPPHIYRELRTDKIGTIAEVETSGFRLIEEIKLLKQSYMLIFDAGDRFSKP